MRHAKANDDYYFHNEAYVLYDKFYKRKEHSRTHHKALNEVINYNSVCRGTKMMENT